MTDLTIRMEPDAIDRVLLKYADRMSMVRGYSMHSMRATLSPRRWRTACN